MTPQQLINQAQNLYLKGNIAKAQEINNFLAKQNLPERDKLSAKLLNLTLLSSPREAQQKEPEEEPEETLFSQRRSSGEGGDA